MKSLLFSYWHFFIKRIVLNEELLEQPILSSSTHGNRNSAIVKIEDSVHHFHSYFYLIYKSLQCVRLFEYSASVGRTPCRQIRTTLRDQRYFPPQHGKSLSFSFCILPFSFSDGLVPKPHCLQTFARLRWLAFSTRWIPLHICLHRFQNWNHKVVHPRQRELVSNLHLIETSIVNKKAHRTITLWNEHHRAFQLRRQRIDNSRLEMLLHLSEVYWFLKTRLLSLFSTHSDLLYIRHAFISIIWD